MNKEDANKLLDAVKDGQPISRSEIDAALIATGDHAADGGEGVDSEIPSESETDRESKSILMVAQDLIRHSENSWSVRR